MCKRSRRFLKRINSYFIFYNPPWSRLCRISGVLFLWGAATRAPFREGSGSSAGVGGFDSSLQTSPDSPPCTHARHASHVSEPRRVSTRICAAESPPLRATSLRNQSENRSDRQCARAIGVGNVVDPIRRNGKPCHDSLGPPPATRGAVQPCAEYKGGKRRREVRFKEGGHQQVQHCGTWIFVPM